jgi:predicted porin
LMNKKLLAVAVAGALAAPGVAFAQASSVTISGFFKVGWENLNMSNASPARLNSSQNRVVDNSSRIIFTSIEDLGNGLSAIGNLDVRFAPDQPSNIQVSNPIGSGNTYVGLQSKTMGRLTMGRWDLHYGHAPANIADRAGALGASSVSLFDYIGATPIANATRTNNVVRYDTPNWSGFDGTIAWSANPVGNSDNDMVIVPAAGSNATLAPGAIPGNIGIVPGGTLAAAPLPGGANTSRKGDGWNINPRYDNGPLHLEYSYWRARPDAPTVVTNDQLGNVLAGSYKFGGFKIGLGWNRSRLNNTDTGTRVAERTTWILPMSYTWGPNLIHAYYARAGTVNCDIAVCATTTGSDSKANMIAVAYEYALSKRTSLAATYARINNGANINYNFFTSASLGSTDAVPVNGEKPRMLQFTIFHSF